MPRLSLYRPEKGNDYKFIDKTIWEMFQVGGTDVFVHKYLGPRESTDTAGSSPSQPAYSETDPTKIQDLLFLENRDRKYDPDVYIMRGVYSISDIDFNLSQFGLFLQNDTIFITFHINDTVEKLGRKIISGDVIELPHLKDDFALNDLQFALKRFYVIEEVNRAAEGFSVTWYPHLYRAKCKPLVDSQEYKDILDGLAGEDTDLTLRDIMSTYEREMQITQAVLDQAEADAPKSGFDVTRFYHIKTDDEGMPALVQADTTAINSSSQTQATDAEGNLLYNDNGDPVYVGITASTVFESADKIRYQGYIVEDGIPGNGAPFTAGIGFPSNPTLGQFCLRKDYQPNRLFRYDGRRWVKVEDSIRMTMSNLSDNDVESGADFQGKEARKTLKTGFINNDNVSEIQKKSVPERQSLSKALRPEADQ